MSTSPELLYAILAMDSYNRGYDPGIVLTGTAVGNAAIRDITVPLEDWKAADFYAAAYDTEYGKVIAYRGTDNPLFELAFVDYPIAFNDDYDEAQVHLANRFYNAVTAASGGTTLTLTGHSLGGALAGFVGMVNSEPIVSVAPIDFVPAFLNFKELIDRYLLVKDTPQASTDTIDVPGRFFDVNTVKFAVETLTAMGIPLDDIPTLQTQLSNYTGMHLSGEVAEISRSAQTPSTPILDGFLQHMGSIVGIVGAHSASLSVIVKYAEDEFLSQGASALHFTTITEELFSALFDKDIAELAGADQVSGQKDPVNIMRDAIAYSALDEGALVFGNTGIRALYDDANELGKLVLDGKIPLAYGDPLPGIAEGIVQFAGQMALNEVDYAQHPDWRPELGFLRLNADETVMTAHFDKELWNLGGDADQPVKIKGIETIYDEFFNQEEEAPEVLAAIEQLYNQQNIIEDASVITRIDFELGNGDITIDLEEYEENLETTVPYNPGTTSLFVALNGAAEESGFAASAALGAGGAMDDLIDGTRDNNVIVGGDGDDILYGHLGKDILLGGRGRDRFIDLVTEVAPDGRTNEDDIYYGEPSDESLLGLFLAWLGGSQVEDTVEYRLADERDASVTLPSQGLEIASLKLSTVGEAEAIELAITDLNSGETGTDHLVDIDKVILSERRDEVVVNPAWLDVPLWVDLGKATNGVVTKSDYDRVSYENLGGLVTVNGATQPGGSNGPVTDRSYIKLIIDLVASALDFPVPVTPVLSAFTSNDPLRVSGAEHVELTNADDTLWYGPISHAVGFLTGWPDDADYPTFGIIDGKGGHDILVVRNAKYVFAGDPLHPEEPNSAVAGQDLNLEVRGGPGSDQLMVIGGIGAEVVGGPGTDLLFNYSYKGKLYGGRKDGTGDDETDIFWWSSSNSFIMDAGKNDLLQMYGVTLTGGTNSAYGLAANYGNNVKDWLLPFVRYGATDGGQLLIYTTWSGPDNATIVEDYDYGGFEEELLGIAKPGDLGMLFRIYGGDDLEVRLFYVVWGHLATFIEALWTFAKGLQWKTHDDPLVLDLDGDGIETSTPEQGGVHFDLDNDFFSEKTGWVKADDGLLVWDQDGNRRIDDSTELFGSPGTDGFTELAALDDNADGVIDAQDATFPELEVWRDLNQDGRTDPGELFTLAELDITSLGAVGTEINHTTPNGNLLREHATFTRGDGTTGNIYEAIFQNDQIDTQFRGERGLAEWERSAHTERIAA